MCRTNPPTIKFRPHYYDLSRNATCTGMSCDGRRRGSMPTPIPISRDNVPRPTSSQASSCSSKASDQPNLSSRAPSPSLRIPKEAANLHFSRPIHSKPLTNTRLAHVLARSSNKPPSPTSSPLRLSPRTSASLFSRPTPQQLPHLSRHPLITNQDAAPSQYALHLIDDAPEAARGPLSLRHARQAEVRAPAVVEDDKELNDKGDLADAEVCVSDVSSSPSIGLKGSKIETRSDLRFVLPRLAKIRLRCRS